LTGKCERLSLHSRQITTFPVQTSNKHIGWDAINQLNPASYVCLT